MDFNITNMIGLVSFSSILILLFFYLMRPKPFKKIIPSLIFLETSKKKKNMASFFRRFVKDPLLILQLLVLLLLCASTLGITTQLVMRKVNKEITFVIDASASSKAYEGGREVFYDYVDIARQNIGVRNSVILIKNTPEVLATQTNPLNTYRILASIRPTDSLSNIWDSMMLASEISEGKVIVLSDFADSNSRQISTAKQILEAKGLEVELINPGSANKDNTGIISYRLVGDTAIVDIKNYNDYEKTIEINGKSLYLAPNSVGTAEISLTPGRNTISITKDSFEVDDSVDILVPKESDIKALFITNKRKNNLYDALTSMDFVDVKRAEPPIIPDGDYDLYVISDVDYSDMLPGTLDKISSKISRGSTLIIAAQDKLMDMEVLPVNIISGKNEDMSILNNRVPGFEDYNFGLSTKSLEATLKQNTSIVLAEANDKLASPVIAVSSYGLGKVMYYGIIDDYNSFRLSTQYPLFWIDSLEYLISKQDLSEVNKKIGEVLYGDIRDPDNRKTGEYISAEKKGIYKVNGEEVAVNLLNSREFLLGEVDTAVVESEYETVKVEQTVELLPLIIAIASLLVLLELYFIKKRGDL